MARLPRTGYSRTGLSGASKPATRALAGGFVAHAVGLRARYVAAGILCGLFLLAALPLLAASLRDP